MAFRYWQFVFFAGLLTASMSWAQDRCIPIEELGLKGSGKELHPPWSGKPTVVKGAKASGSDLIEIKAHIDQCFAQRSIPIPNWVQTTGGARTSFSTNSLKGQVLRKSDVTKLAEVLRAQLDEDDQFGDSAALTDLMNKLASTQKMVMQASTLATLRTAASALNCGGGMAAIDPNLGRCSWYTPTSSANYGIYRTVRHGPNGEIVEVYANGACMVVNTQNGKVWGSNFATSAAARTCKAGTWGGPIGTSGKQDAAVSSWQNGAILNWTRYQRQSNGTLYNQGLTGMGNYGYTKDGTPFLFDLNSVSEFYVPDRINADNESPIAVIPSVTLNILSNPVKSVTLTNVVILHGDPADCIAAYARTGKVPRCPIIASDHPELNYIKQASELISISNNWK